MVGCEDAAVKGPQVEHLSIEGFVRGVEIKRAQTFFQFDIVVVGFEDGRVKFFLSSLPDMVKQGANNKILFKRTHYKDGNFSDIIEGTTSYPEPKESNTTQGK